MNSCLLDFQCLLNSEEIEIKTKLWMEENKDYLEKLKGEFIMTFIQVRTTCAANDLINIQGEGGYFHPMKGNPDSRIQEYLTCGIQNLGKFCLKNRECWSLESGIQLKGSAVLLKMGIQNPSSTDKGWNPIPGIRISQRGIENLSLVPLHWASTVA